MPSAHRHPKTGRSPSGAKLRVAVLQMNSQVSVRDNLNTVEKMTAKAVKQGAKFVALPEYFYSMAPHGELFPLAERAVAGPIQAALRALARKHGIYLLAGSLPLKARGKKLSSASVLYSPAGKAIASYAKRHLFDHDVPGTRESHRESDYFVPGRKIVTAKAAAASLGLSICYDLRFPEHYRILSERGAEILAVPSAFNARTGQAHWHVLLRARAIENLCFVIAPGQVGECSGKQTYGHSLIVSPWGEILAEASGDVEQTLVAELDLEGLRKLRADFPVLSHRRSR